MNIHDLKIKITTKSGSSYIIDDGYFAKNNTEWHSVHDLFFFNLEDLGIVRNWPEFFAYSKDMPKTFEPEVGKHMYISGRDVWWISTEIVGVEEVSND
jgi:hypothetical protein